MKRPDKVLRRNSSDLEIPKQTWGDPLITAWKTSQYKQRTSSALEKKQREQREQLAKQYKKILGLADMSDFYPNQQTTDNITDK